MITFLNLQRRSCASCSFTPGGVPLGGVPFTVSRAGASDEDVTAKVATRKVIHHAVVTDIATTNETSDAAHLIIAVIAILVIAPAAPVAFTTPAVVSVVAIVGTAVNIGTLITASALILPVAAITLHRTPLTTFMPSIAASAALVARIFVTSASHTTASADVTGTTAMVSPAGFSVCPSLASLGGSPNVAAVWGGVFVADSPFPSTNDGDGGCGIHEGVAAATTTRAVMTVTTSAFALPTIPFPHVAHPDRGILDVWLILLLPTMPIDYNGIADISDGSSLLLPRATPISSHISNSIVGRRVRKSGEPRRTRHFRGRSPPLPTVAADGAAWRPVGCPAASADSLARVAPPRPAPAGLLSSSLRPQPGRETQRSVRVGFASRVAEVHAQGADVVWPAMRGVEED